MCKTLAIKVAAIHGVYVGFLGGCVYGLGLLVCFFACGLCEVSVDMKKKNVPRS